MTTIEDVDTVVIGAGHAGLAVSRLLTEAGHDHVVLDRGRIGERWRTERWDSLRLLTPAWMTRLPGWQYAGSDPDGFLSAGQFLGMLEGYAASFGAPVVGGTDVLSVARSGHGEGYDVLTDRSIWRASHVVVATGPHGVPHVPAALAKGAEVDVVTSNRYRNPSRLAPGGVLVVGASSSGVQIADELVRAGRHVVLAVGRHTRMPRSYRGMDVFWWLDSTGRLAHTIDEVRDPDAARREPSLQLVGRAEDDIRGPDVDLPALHARGVVLAGRLEGISGRVATFAADLQQTVAAADRTLARVLEDVDRYVELARLTSEVGPAMRPATFTAPPAPRRVHLNRERISTILLATGYRAEHSWINLPVKGEDGIIRQRRGITAAPGVYVVGQRFQHRRDSGFIDGARHDAHAVVSHLLTRSLPKTTARSPRTRSSSQAAGPADEERAA
jgi:putative flavoprotein involved in K+ transport